MTETPTIRVPARAMPTMELLAELSEDKRSGLLRALNDEPMPASVAELSERVADVLGDGGDEVNARSVLGELFGLSALSGSHEYDLAGVGRAVAQTPDLELDAEAAESFGAFFTEMLKSRAARTLGRASDVNREHDRIFHLVRIVSDVTPVFDDVESKPVGAIIGHRLRLRYWEISGEKELEISLTSEQLKDLGKAVSRAEVKTTSLQSALGDWGLPALDIGGSK